jgi:hypothetical protein
VSEPLLYVVATIAPSEKTGGTRAPVVCTSLERAKKIVETNEGDIWEFSYDLAVIETFIPDQLYSATDERHWYRWNLEKMRYMPIDCPEEYQNVSGFGVG